MSRFMKTIEIILSKINQENEIKTSIPKYILREVLYLCTKEVHFMINDVFTSKATELHWVLH